MYVFGAIRSNIAELIYIITQMYNMKGERRKTKILNCVLVAQALCQNCIIQCF